MSATFELLRFEATPLTAAAAIVELDGVFAGLAPTRPRLLVESGGVSREMPALEAGGSPGPSDTVSGERPLRGWSASFAVPLTALADAGSTFALVPGRGPLIELPPPTPRGDADDDRFVKLARTANDLRHRLSVALDRAEDRDHLARELAEMRGRVTEAEQRVAEAHEAAMQAREEQARAEGEAEVAREALARAREEARAEVREEIETARGEAEAARAQLADAEQRARGEVEAARAQLGEAEQRAVTAEDEARAARLELRDARARIEALTRQTRTTRTAVARERVPTAAPRIPVAADEEEEFRAARLGPDWDEGRAEAEARATADTAALHDEPDPTISFEPAPADHLDPHAEEAEPETTAVLEEVPGEEPPAEHAGEEPGPELWRDDSESVRVLRPRTLAGRRRPAPVLSTDEIQGEEILDPAAVGARLMQPAELTPRQRAVAIATNPRFIVGAIFFLLLVALALIFAGVGPV